MQKSYCVNILPTVGPAASRRGRDINTITHIWLAYKGRIYNLRNGVLLTVYLKVKNGFNIMQNDKYSVKYDMKHDVCHSDNYDLSLSAALMANVSINNLLDETSCTDLPLCNIIS